MDEANVKKRQEIKKEKLHRTLENRLAVEYPKRIVSHSVVYVKVSIAT